MSIDKKIENTTLIEALPARVGGGQTYLLEWFWFYQSQGNVRLVDIVLAELRDFCEEILRKNRCKSIGLRASVGLSGSSRAEVLF